MICELISVGTELLLGDILNTNAQYLAAKLATAGVALYHQSVVGDNAGRLREALETALARSDLVIATGGLGPTYDDITKEVAAQALGLPLEEDAGELERIAAYFAAMGRPMTENNRKQACIPAGAKVLPNANGTAPGIWMEREEKGIVLLPGPPREMRPMFDRYVLPVLQARTGRCIYSRTVKIYGLGESYVESRLAERMRAAENPTIAPYAKTGEVELRISALAADEAAARALTDPVAAEIAAAFGAYVYSTEGQSLEEALVALLAEKGLKVATAESCTGGLVSQRITAVAGASAVFDCGVCSYANGIKAGLLGVREETLAAHGAVSEAVAAQMAEGVRRLSGADIGISTTGIAGPGGGTAEKPVGTVCFGVSSARGTTAVRVQFPPRGDDVRAHVRQRASSEALYRALQEARELPAAGAR